MTILDIPLKTEGTTSSDRQMTDERGRQMAFDALKALQDAGNPVESFSSAQRNVLSQLDEREVATWNSIKQRLDAVGGSEIEGHGDVNL